MLRQSLLKKGHLYVRVPSVSQQVQTLWPHSESIKDMAVEQQIPKAELGGNSNEDLVIQYTVLNRLNTLEVYVVEL